MCVRYLVLVGGVEGYFTTLLVGGAELSYFAD